MQVDAGATTALATAAGRALGSDPHGFAALYIRHRSSFTAHARRYLRDPRDADEVVQEAFLRLFLAMPELETELQALAYCRRTITNLCIDRYRADGRRPRLVTLEGAPVDQLAEDDTGDPVVRAEDAALVREALSQLPELHRAALVKREIEEKPLPVIADELDVAEDSVKHLLFRARRGLRKLLAGTSVAPGVDAELTRGLRPAARGASGGAAGLLLLALLGLGSGPDLRSVPVVGVDLPDVLGVTAVVEAVGGAVRDVVRVVVPGGEAHVRAAGTELRSGPVSRSSARTEPRAEGGVPRAPAEQAAQPIGVAGAPASPSRRYPMVGPGPTGTGGTITVVTMVDGKPVTTVVPAPDAQPPASVPGTGGQATVPGVSTGRAEGPSLPVTVAPPPPPPPPAPAPKVGRDLPAGTPVGPVVPAADAPTRPTGSDASVRSPRTDEAVQKPADKGAQQLEKAADKSAQKIEKAADKSAQKVERAADKSADAIARAQEQADRAARQATGKAAEAVSRAGDKADRAAEKAADRADRAAERATAPVAPAAAAAAAAQQAAAVPPSATVTAVVPAPAP